MHSFWAEILENIEITTLVFLGRKLERIAGGKGAAYIN